ncbi:fumarylacetoacetate hydrolase family protein [Nonomuraea sp. B5E05]|uniref:fumarylacetoacetate hydrolase family protein n=1 Tax=Nonomuraea sp. B5E05 TaxID=3153569 RepID=UPI00325FEF6D
MRLAVFDDWRLGVVSPDGMTISDVTGALPGGHDPDPHGAGWWVRLCARFPALRPRLAEAARDALPCRLSDVRLRAPVLNPGKVIACASNYAAHVSEMRDVVLPRNGTAPAGWLLDFDVFLKAPSSISGPGDPVLLPGAALSAGREVHHESELTVVIGQGGKDIDESSALSHVLGYLIGLDITERGDGDRSRRKSHDTFTPLGPWLTTAEEAGDPQSLNIELRVRDTIRQQVSTADMLTPVARIISYASRLMRLEPGDVIMTGAPPGVGPIVPGDIMYAAISGLGHMTVPVRAA